MKTFPFYNHQKPIEQLPIHLRRFLLPHLKPKLYRIEEGLLLTHYFNIYPYFEIQTETIRMVKESKLEIVNPTKKLILLYMKKGEVLTSHPDLGTFTIKENHYYLFCVPQSEQNMAFLQTGEYQIFKLHINLNWIQKFEFNKREQQKLDKYKNDPTLGCCLFMSAISPILRNITENLEQMVIANPLIAEFNIKAQKMELLKMLIKDYKNISRRKENIKDDTFLEILNYINAHLHLPKLLPTVCDHFKLSIKQLRRLFKKHLNLSPSKHILHIRMGQAEIMILKSNTDLLKISELIGYENYSSFAASFKAIYQVSPSKMRKERDFYKPTG